MYHVIMNDPMKTRKVLSCMAITGIIKNKKNIILFTFVGIMSCLCYRHCQEIIVFSSVGHNRYISATFYV
jgi:hypothetical protein